MKGFVRVLIAIALYALVTFGFCALVQVGAAGQFPTVIVSPEMWQKWCQRSTLITAGLSLAFYFLYQLLTSRRLLGGSSIDDPNQNRFCWGNALATVLHLAVTVYFGFWIYGYATCFLEMLTWGFDRYYFFVVPAIGYTPLFWLLTRFLSNSCVYRYKRWQWVR